MSELQNPLFDEEKEFLERKKLEYERALRGDVDQIKEKSVKAGKVALVGAGLAGSIWLITKAFKSKSKKRKHPRYDDEDYSGDEQDDDFDGPNYEAEDDDQGSDQDYEFGTGYFSGDNGKRYKSTSPYKSAAESAQAFVEQDEQNYQADDFGFGTSTAGSSHDSASANYAVDGSEDVDGDTNGFNPEEFEDDPFQDLPYDDSRRLPTSHAFDDSNSFAARKPKNSSSNLVGSVLQAFLQSDTGKMLVAQAAAVALAMVTKKVSEFFPAPKNSDLADSPAATPAAAGVYSVASPASSVTPDASNPPQSL